MKNSILKVVLGTIIFIGLIWTGCEEVGKMSWALFLSKIGAICVIGICGYFLDRIYKAEKAAKKVKK